MFDLWEPAQERTKAGNVAFSCYAKHTQEMEDIIETLVAAARQGETELELDLGGYDVFSDDDWEYMQKEVQRRL